MGSPIIDLMFFLTTSVDYNVLSESKDALIYVYHDTLSLVLQKLNYAGYVPTLNELQIEFLKRGSLGEYQQLFGLGGDQHSNMKIPFVFQRSFTP